MKNLILLTTIFIGSYAEAQLDPNYTHFGFNQININPSFTGSYESLEATGLFRAQWVSFPGAPLSQAASVHTRLKRQKIGLGLSLNNSKMGPLNNTGAFGNFAYRIRIGYNSGYLSMGLSAGVYLRSNKLGDLNIISSNDPEFLQNVTSQVLPNFGFGMHYENRGFYVGISFPRLLKNEVDFNSNSTGSLATFNRLVYATIGGEMNVAPRKGIVLKPAALFQMTANVKPQLSILAPFYIKEKMWAGPTLRLFESAGLMAGMNVTPQLQIGYSFDYSYKNQSFKYNGGSHEIMLRFRMGEKAASNNTPADTGGQ